MANLLLSPSMSAKLKTRESAKKLKNGSPKLQEVLRQKCRERMRQKRGELFSRSRSGLDDDDEVQEVLTTIVRQELSQLSTSDWSVTSSEQDAIDEDEANQIKSEILAEQETWILEEYERMAKNDEEMAALIYEESMKETVTCPACQKSFLSETQDSIVCNACGLTLPPVVSVTDLGRFITEKVNSHSEGCPEVPAFTVTMENNNNSLYLVCHRCSALSVII